MILSKSSATVSWLYSFTESSILLPLQVLIPNNLPYDLESKRDFTGQKARGGGEGSPLRRDGKNGPSSRNDSNNDSGRN